MSRYYFGDRTVALTIPDTTVAPPTLTDWPLLLVSANVNGQVQYTVPFQADPTQFNQPVDITAAYVPGATLDPTLTGDQVLALPGVVSVVTPFPASFGAVGLDQNVGVQLPLPLPVGPVVVVLLGRVA